MAVYVKLNMEEIPENCMDCAYEHCTLPYKKNTYKDQLKKSYLAKRHGECPLVKFEEGQP